MTGPSLIWFGLLVVRSEACFPALRSPRLLSIPSGDPDEYFQVSGTVQRADPEDALPSSVRMHWHSLMENDDVKIPCPDCPSEAWSYTGGISNIQDNKFTLKMDISKEEFDQDITLHPSMKKIWLGKRSRGPLAGRKPNVTLDQLNNLKFAMGRILDGKIASMREMPRDDVYEKGLAMADMYAVFYKNDTEFIYEKLGIFDNCHWLSKIPQGFSCGRGARPDPSCGDGFFERFEIVDCSEVILKVASRSCAHSDWHGFNGFECQDGEYCDDYWTRRKDGRIPDLGNKPDCHVGINWT